MKIDAKLKKEIEEDWDYLKTILRNKGNPKVALMDLEDDFRKLGLELED